MHISEDTQENGQYLVSVTRTRESYIGHLPVTKRAFEKSHLDRKTVESFPGNDSASREAFLSSLHDATLEAILHEPERELAGSGGDALSEWSQFDTTPGMTWFRRLIGCCVGSA